MVYLTMLLLDQAICRCEEEVVIKFKIVTRNFREGTGENHENFNAES
jgi:hypothetical protein